MNNFLETSNGVKEYISSQNDKNTNERFFELCELLGLNFKEISQIKGDEGLKIISGEQSGFWLKPSHLARIELNGKLVGRFGKSINKNLSGIYSFPNDTFTGNGAKGEHLRISNPFGEISLLSQSQRKKFNGFTYDSIFLPPELISQFYGEIEKILNPENNFRKKLGQFSLDGNEDSNRKIKQQINSSGIVSSFGDGKKELSQEELKFFKKLFQDSGFLGEKFREDLKYLESLQSDENGEKRNWYEIFKKFNEKVFGTEIKSFEGLFNQIISLIKDPKKLGKNLIELGYGKIDNNGRNLNVISIAGIIVEKEGKKSVKNVFYCGERNKLFVEGGKNEPEEEISWEEIKTLAQKGLTTGPSGIIEYLILFLLGYILVDDGHEVGFDTNAKKLFSEVTKITSPVISIAHVTDKINFVLNEKGLLIPEIGKENNLDKGANNTFGFYHKGVRDIVNHHVNNF